MIYTCSKQSKIDRLWGVFMGHLIQMQNAGIKVEYIRKGEVVLNGIRYKPIYHENTMSYDLIERRRNIHHIVLIGHDIQPLINYLQPLNRGNRPSGEMLEEMIATCFGAYTPENYEKAIHLVHSLGTMGAVSSSEADWMVSKMDEISEMEG